MHLIQRVQDGYDSIFCAGKGYRKSIRNCCSGGTKKDNCDKPPAERSGQSHEGRRPPIIFKRPPLDIITHENRPFSLDPFNVAFKGEFEELEQGDIEETNQGEDQMKADLQASLFEIQDLVDPE